MKGLNVTKLLVGPDKNNFASYYCQVPTTALVGLIEKNVPDTSTTKA